MSLKVTQAADFLCFLDAVYSLIICFRFAAYATDFELFRVGTYKIVLQMFCGSISNTVDENQQRPRFSCLAGTGSRPQ
uniref:Putative secreted protein n=1 Tax=Anopheles darlingi TaxID=43151 RepID=A0A2M4DE28_ANODA